MYSKNVPGRDCNPEVPNPGIGDIPIPGFRDYKNLLQLHFFEFDTELLHAFG